MLCFISQYLPKEELYAPPLNIRILDKRNFGRMPMVGTHIIKSLKDFHVDPVLSPEEKAALKGDLLGVWWCWCVTSDFPPL